MKDTLDFGEEHLLMGKVLSLAPLPLKVKGVDGSNLLISIIPTGGTHFIWIIVAPPDSGKVLDCCFVNI